VPIPPSLLVSIEMDGLLVAIPIAKLRVRHAAYSTFAGFHAKMGIDVTDMVSVGLRGMRTNGATPQFGVGKVCL